MAPSLISRTGSLRISALALAALPLTSTAMPTVAQTVYREFDDGRVEAYSGEPEAGLGAAPLRRPPPRAYDDEDDDRFERDDESADPDDLLENDEIQDDAGFDDDRQGHLDLATPPRPGTGPEDAPRKAPQPPPSVIAKPDEKAWKPAL